MSVTLEQAQEIAREWAAFMEIDEALFSVQVGSFDGMQLTTDAHTALAEMPQGSHAYGVTVGNPDNTAFIVGINEDCPPEKLRQVIIHELVHVYSFAAVGSDERENMELLTDQVALLIQRLRELEAA